MNLLCDAGSFCVLISGLRILPVAYLHGRASDSEQCSDEVLNGERTALV